MKIELITIPDKTEIAINISLKVSPETFKTLNDVNHTKKYLVYGGEIKEYVPNILTRSQLNKILAAGGKVKMVINMNSKDMEVMNLL